MKSRRHRLRIAGLTALVLLGLAPAARAAVSYGPILGRGRTPDTVVVRWGTTASAPTSLELRPAGTLQSTTLTGPAGLDHEIVATGLAPSTLYDYVALSGADSARATFATCPSAGEPLDFVAYGDNRSDPTTHRALVARILAEAPDLVLNSGDIVPDGQRTQYLSEFFPAAASLVREIPFLASPGNHDFHTAFADGFGSVFPLPADAGGAKQPYYEVVCGNAMFIALDANDPRDADQLTFLAAALASARADATIQHVFPFFHHPPYSSGGSHGDQLTVRAAFSPLFEDPANKVSIVFTGHDHVYDRIVANGVTYVVTGGGGAGLDGRGATSEGGVEQFFANVHHYVHLSVQGQLADARVVDDRGGLVESFQVRSAVADPAPTGGDPGLGGDPAPDESPAPGDEPDPVAGTGGSSPSDGTPPAPGDGGGLGCAIARSNDGSALLLGVALTLLARTRRRRRRPVAVRARTLLS